MTKASDPKSYTAGHDVFTAGKYHKAGEVFVTNDEPADTWTEVKPSEAHIDQAATDKVPGDAPIEGLDLSALRAVAVTKNINTKGMGKQDLIDAIHAANEPRL